MILGSRIILSALFYRIAKFWRKGLALYSAILHLTITEYEIFGGLFPDVIL
jgi:hypothetical protein